MLQRLVDAGLVKGTTVGVDATTLEANAALRSIVRRDTGESYQGFLTELAGLRHRNTDPGLSAY
jgi:transposase